MVLQVINFVDYSLNQGAPAGHKSAETPIGHESSMPWYGNDEDFKGSDNEGQVGSEDNLILKQPNPSKEQR